MYWGAKWAPFTHSSPSFRVGPKLAPDPTASDTVSLERIGTAFHFAVDRLVRNVIRKSQRGTDRACSEVRNPHGCSEDVK